MKLHSLHLALCHFLSLRSGSTVIPPRIESTNSSETEPCHLNYVLLHSIRGPLPIPKPCIVIPVVILSFNTPTGLKCECDTAADMNDSCLFTLMNNKLSSAPVNHPPTKSVLSQLHYNTVHLADWKAIRAMP